MISELVGSYVGGMTLCLISGLIILVVFPQAKLEFPPQRLTRVSVQNFRTTVRYGRESLSLCRPLNGSSSMKFSCATSIRHFIPPLNCSAQPIVKVAAFGSILLSGAVLLRGTIAGVRC